MQQDELRLQEEIKKLKTGILREATRFQRRGALPYIEYFVPGNILLNDSSIDSESGFIAGKNLSPKTLIQFRA